MERYYESLILKNCSFRIVFFLFEYSEQQINFHSLSKISEVHITPHFPKSTGRDGLSRSVIIRGASGRAHAPPWKHTVSVYMCKHDLKPLVSLLAKTDMFPLFQTVEI